MIEAVIVAGGKGRRMGELTRSQQKCLLQVQDEPILFSILKALKDGFGSVKAVIPVLFMKDDVRDFLYRNRLANVEIICVPQLGQIGSWSAYQLGREFVRGNFLAMPGDVLTTPQVYISTLEAFVQSGNMAVVAFSDDVEQINTHGVAKVKNREAEEMLFPAPRKVEAGYSRDMTIVASDKRFFDLQAMFPYPGESICKTFRDAIQHGGLVSINETSEPWIHLGYVEDLRKELK